MICSGEHGSATKTVVNIIIILFIHVACHILQVGGGGNVRGLLFYAHLSASTTSNLFTSLYVYLSLRLQVHPFWQGDPVEGAQSDRSMGTWLYAIYVLDEGLEIFICFEGHGFAFPRDALKHQSKVQL